MAIIWFYSLNIKGGRAYLAEKKMAIIWFYSLNIKGGRAYLAGKKMAISFYSLNIKGGRAYLAGKKIRGRSLRSLQYLAYHEIILSVL